MSADYDTLISPVRNEARVCTFISLTSSLCIAILYFFVRSVRKTPGWLIFRGTWCDIVCSISILALLYSKDEGEDINGQLLKVTALGQVCGATIRSFMYMYLLSIYRNPFQPERLRGFHVPIVVMAPFLSWLALTAAKEWLNVDDSTEGIALMGSLGLVVFPLLVFYLFGGSLFMTVVYLVHSAKNSVSAKRPSPCIASAASGLGNSTSTPTHITSLARQRVSKHALAYFVLFGLELGVAGVILFFWAVYDKWDAHSHYYRAIVYIVTLQPAFSFLGWIIINDMIYKLCGCCSNKRRTLMDVERKASDKGKRLSQTEYTTQEQGIKEHGFKEDLRFELIYDVVRGLGELAQQELHGPADNRKRFFRRDSRSYSKRMSIELSRKNTLDLADLESLSPTPVVVAESEKTSQLPAAVTETSKAASFDFSALGRHELSNDCPTKHRSSEPVVGSTLVDIPITSKKDENGQRPLLLPQRTQSTDFNEETQVFRQVSRARHYEPQIFAVIRERFGISRSMFAASFPNDLNELSADWRNKLKECVSEGASGSFFYRVFGRAADDNTSQLIVKQIEQSEKKLLLRILPAYEAHVRKQNGKSLIQYFGVHSMPLNWNFSRKVYFVVMRNFLPVKPWLAFDLKGATANRRALAEDVLYRKKGVGVKLEFGTLRDWEWLDVAMAVELSPSDRQELADVVAADSAFLAAQGLLDYSMLLGIHRVPNSLLPDQRQAYLERMKKAGGYISLDHQKVYFFGIIDILEGFGCRWKVQHYVLKAAYCLSCQRRHSDGISAMPPELYADRFLTFLRKEVLIMEESENNGDDKRNSQRWSPLWDNRQRGLVRERIQAEQEDHHVSVEVLQQRTKTLEDEVSTLRRQLNDRCQELERVRDRRLFNEMSSS